jgi:hypothetical protein
VQSLFRKKPSSESDDEDGFSEIGVPFILLHLRLLQISGEKKKSRGANPVNKQINNNNKPSVCEEF